MSWLRLSDLLSNAADCCSDRLSALVQRLSLCAPGFTRLPRLSYEPSFGPTHVLQPPRGYIDLCSGRTDHFGKARGSFLPFRFLAITA
jgi:hypothetical protein